MLDSRCASEGCAVWFQTSVHKWLWDGEVSTQCCGSTGEGDLFKASQLRAEWKGEGRETRLGFLDPDFEGTTGYPVYNFHKQQIFSRSILFFFNSTYYVLGSLPGLGIQGWLKLFRPFEKAYTLERRKLQTVRSVPQGRACNRSDEGTGNSPFQPHCSLLANLSPPFHPDQVSIPVLLPLDLWFAPPKNVSQICIILQGLAHIWPPHWSLQETLSDPAFPEELQHSCPHTTIQCLVPAWSSLPYLSWVPHFPN